MVFPSNPVPEVFENVLRFFVGKAGTVIQYSDGRESQFVVGWWPIPSLCGML